MSTSPLTSEYFVAYFSYLSLISAAILAGSSRLLRSMPESKGVFLSIATMLSVAG